MADSIVNRRQDQRFSMYVKGFSDGATLARKRFTDSDYLRGFREAVRSRQTHIENFQKSIGDDDTIHIA